MKLRLQRRRQAARSQYRQPSFAWFQGSRKNGRMNYRPLSRQRSAKVMADFLTLTPEDHRRAKAFFAQETE